MKATILMFLAVANLAGRVDGLKNYRAMPTETDRFGLLIFTLLMLVAFGILANWLKVKR